jgi:hypothetical protein
MLNEKDNLQAILLLFAIHGISCTNDVAQGNSAYVKKEYFKDGALKS